MGLLSHMGLWFAYLLSLFFAVFWFITFWEHRGSLKAEESKKQGLNEFPFVSIIIPAYNEEKHITLTLESVLSLNYPKDKYEIIVVNDGSKDNTKKKVEDLIKQHRDRKIIFINQKNQGKATSLNNGLKKVKGEFFACLDADSYVEKDTLQRMLALYEREKDENLAIVTPAMRVNSPKTLLQKFQRIEYLISMFMARLMSRLNCIYVAPGPFSLYRTSIIKKLGGFDVKSLTEDQEIAYRTQKHHYKLRHCYNAYVHTSAPPNLKKLFKQRNRWYKGGIFNLIKYREMIWNKCYGDFGIIQMTSNIAIFVLGAITISSFSYYVIWPILKLIHKLAFINFNIIPFIKAWRFTGSLLDINVTLVMVLGLMLCLAAAIFYVSHKNAKEKINPKSILTVILYFFVYYLILSVIELVVFMEVIGGRKQKW